MELFLVDAFSCFVVDIDFLVNHSHRVVTVVLKMFGSELMLMDGQLMSSPIGSNYPAVSVDWAVE
jgi:hypothetical protein